MHSPARTSEAAILDLAALRDRANDDEELVREVLSDFLGTAEEMLAKIALSIADGRLAEASKDAHRLRGALLSLGAARAAATASELEFVCGASAGLPADEGDISVSSGLTRLRSDLRVAMERMSDYLES